ncbi:MAG: pyrrolo-quinoline quinone, partial [Roseiflexaceae bacterium]|nr:pyrrolo-quinoline quinone [Roseiflexaceae bacterium]
DGAIVALTSGNPQASAASAVAVAPAAPPPPPDAQPVAVIPHTAAREWEGRTVVATGTLEYVFNNGKQVLLGFSYPHQGSFKALIRREDWARFGGRPEERYRVGQAVRVRGAMAWYQGDPAIYVTTPEQIEVVDEPLAQGERRMER